MHPMIHRCPLFDDRLGTSPSRSVALDTLHTILFGPAMRWLSAVFNRMVLGNPWNVRGDPEYRKKIALKRLSVEMQTFFDDEEIPNDRQLPELTATMIGLTDEDCHPGGAMKLKAAEVSTLIGFGIILLQRYDVEHRGALEVAGTALQDYFGRTRSAGIVVSASELQGMMDAMQLHLLASEKAMVAFVPKHHLTAHLVSRTMDHGSLTHS